MPGPARPGSRSGKGSAPPSASVAEQPRIVPGLSRCLLAWLDAEPLDGRTVVDVGTGRGRMALALAPRARRVVGLDKDAGALVDARRAARRAGLANVVFVAGDAEEADYRALAAPDPLHVVVAHLCVSDRIVGRAAAGLIDGGLFALVALHVAHWRETGQASRFACDEARTTLVLETAGFRVERLEVEREVLVFGSPEEAFTRTAVLRPRWEADGRWTAWARFVQAGGRTLTRSRVVAVARRQSAGDRCPPLPDQSRSPR